MSAETEIRYLGDLHKLMLDPGDILVLECERFLPEVQRKHLRELFTSKFPCRTVIVLDGGVRLGIVSEKAAA